MLININSSITKSLKMSTLAIMHKLHNHNGDFILIVNENDNDV